MHTLGLGIWGVLPVESFIQIELLGTQFIYIHHSINTYLLWTRRCSKYGRYSNEHNRQRTTLRNLQLKAALLLKCIMSWERQGNSSCGSSVHKRIICSTCVPIGFPASPFLQHLILWVSGKETRTFTRYSRVLDAGDADYIALESPMAQLTNCMPRWFL